MELAPFGVVGPMTIDHAGRYLFIGTGMGLLTYSINPQTGGLTYVTGNIPQNSSEVSASSLVTVAY